jgi:hypothetical protein
MIDEIIANNTPTEPIHIYLDASQSSGTAEAPQVKKLIAGGVEVTIGTSTAALSHQGHRLRRPARAVVLGRLR